MAKGDREFCKADLDDGYTKIADLLLEALAMAKLNGVQKGICLFIWRRTYGWGIKEDRIPLKDFARACGTSDSYISKQLKDLESKNVILRLEGNQGKASVFSINTRVAQWDKGCINVQELNDCTSQLLYKCTSQLLNECARVDTDSALEPQEIEPPLKTGLKTNNKQNNGAHDFFESIWKLYPHKKGKGQVSDAQKIRLAKIGLEELTRCVDRYKKDKPDWKQWQNGSTFFNSGYVDYLDVNFQEGAGPSRAPCQKQPEDPQIIELRRRISEK